MDKYKYEELPTQSAKENAKEVWYSYDSMLMDIFYEESEKILKRYFSSSEMKTIQCEPCFNNDIYTRVNLSRYNRSSISHADLYLAINKINELGDNIFNNVSEEQMIGFCTLQKIMFDIDGNCLDDEEDYE